MESIPTAGFVQGARWMVKYKGSPTFGGMGRLSKEEEEEKKKTPIITCSDSCMQPVEPCSQTRSRTGEPEDQEKAKGIGYVSQRNAK